LASFLRSSALAGVVAGAIGSLGLMLRAGRRTPRLLLVLFVVWVLSPFVALAWAHRVSTRWLPPTRTALYGVSLVVAIASLLIYGELIARPAGSAPAFVWVIVPPVSWLLIATTLATATLISRRRP
jgi:hypothetical protein